MGHLTLEAPGDLPGARDPQMAPNTRVHTDYDPAQRRVAAHAYGWPHRGHLRALFGDVVLDGRPPPILAGSHDSLSIPGADSATSVTWWPPSSGTSTRGFCTRRVLVGVTWP